MTEAPSLISLREIRILAAMAGLVILIATGVALSKRHHLKKAAVAQSVADQHVGAAKDQAEEAKKAEVAAKAHDPAIEQRDRQIAYLKAQVKALKVEQPPVPTDPTPLDQNLIAQNEKQAEVIQQQDAQITELKQKNIDLSAAAEHWHGAYDQMAKAYAAQEVAHKAAMEAQKEASFMRGLKIGGGSLVVGFVLGRSR